MQLGHFCLICFRRQHVWALCPNGYYLNGIRISKQNYLHEIEEAKCCRPQTHPDAYEDCYDENVGASFDRKGWSECKRDGYYMTGFYRSDCDHLYCIETFRCCKMKSGKFSPLRFHELIVSIQILRKISLMVKLYIQLNIWYNLSRSEAWL